MFKKLTLKLSKRPENLMSLSTLRRSQRRCKSKSLLNKKPKLKKLTNPTKPKRTSRKKAKKNNNNNNRHLKKLRSPASQT